MSEQPPDASAPDDDGREPEHSPQRHLVDGIRAYEVDPPAPARTQEHAETAVSADQGTVSGE